MGNHVAAEIEKLVRGGVEVNLPRIAGVGEVRARGFQAEIHRREAGERAAFAHFVGEFFGVHNFHIKGLIAIEARGQRHQHFAGVIGAGRHGFAVHAGVCERGIVGQGDAHELAVGVFHRVRGERDELAVGIDLRAKQRAIRHGVEAFLGVVLFDGHVQRRRFGVVFIGK